MRIRIIAQILSLVFCFGALVTLVAGCKPKSGDETPEETTKPDETDETGETPPESPRGKPQDPPPEEPKEPELTEEELAKQALSNQVTSLKRSINKIKDDVENKWPTVNKKYNGKSKEVGDLHASINAKDKKIVMTKGLSVKVNNAITKVDNRLKILNGYRAQLEVINNEVLGMGTTLKTILAIEEIDQRKNELSVLLGEAQGKEGRFKTIETEFNTGLTSLAREMQDVRNLLPK